VWKASSPWKQPAARGTRRNSPQPKQPSETKRANRGRSYPTPVAADFGKKSDIQASSYGSSISAAALISPLSLKPTSVSQCDLLLATLNCSAADIRKTRISTHSLPHRLVLAQQELRADSSFVLHISKGKQREWHYISLKLNFDWPTR
jgi:hypothetical protein